MARLTINKTEIDGLVTVVRNPISDRRGYFERLFCSEELRELGLLPCQINHSFTQEAGSLRGLHFQNPPHSETKMVTCLKGSVFDVAVDLRANSPTFLKWHGEILSEKNLTSMVIPKGFAHGFQTLEPNCELIYFHDQPYKADAEDGVNVFDKRLKIAWPLPAGNMSDRDSNARQINPEFNGLNT